MDIISSFWDLSKNISETDLFSYTTFENLALESKVNPLLNDDKFFLLILLGESFV